MQNYTKGIIYASITAFFWGFLAIALKVAVREVEPVTIVWFRFSVAFVMLSVWQLAKNPSSFRILKRPPLLLILAGVGLSWNYLGYMMGIHYTTPSNAQLFIQTGPIILAVAGLVFFREKLKSNQIIGFSIAIIGFMFFYRDQLSAFFESQEKYNLGVLLTISGAVAWATYAISQKQLVTKYSAESLNLFLFGFPALIYLPFTDLTPLFHLHWTWWLLMIFLGANTFIAYSCLALALKYLEANKVSVIIIVNPMITFITMGILTELNVNWVAHERFSIITILGAALVFTGAVLVVKRQRKNNRT
jgi:drug/metabolite transporter (DMT)-like permease